MSEIKDDDLTQFNLKYGFLIESLSIKNSVGKNWKIIEAFRWTLTIVIIIVLRDYYSMQITSLLSISVLFQALHVKYQPIENPTEQKIIFFNELMTSLYLYLTLVLTDFNGENLLRDKIGFSLLVLMIFTVAVNLIKTLIKEVRDISAKIKNWL